MTDHFLYVVAFSDEVVKIGRTANVRQRLKAHSNDARKRSAIGLWIWKSAPMPKADAIDGEGQIRRMCEQRWPTAWGREYFAGANFHEVVRFAEDFNELTQTFPLAAS